MKATYLLPLLLIASCTIQQRLGRTNPAATVRQPPKQTEDSATGGGQTLKIEYRGDSVYLVETETIDGDTIPSIQAATVNVISEVRNVAERNGELILSFRITVPELMLGTSREILLRPTLHTGPEDSVLFDPVCLRGRTMDIIQQREYWQLLKHHTLFPRDTAAVGRFILYPYIWDARVDSVTRGKHLLTIDYTENVPSENMPRRLNLTVPGKVVSIDGTAYCVPPRDTIGYLISSMTEFLDTTTRHRIRIVNRNVAVESNNRICFHPGKHTLVDSVGENREEFSSILQLQKKVRELPDLELDSIVITATASPEGSYRNNARLSLLRGQAVADSFFSEFHPVIRTMPENWEDLRDSVRSLHLGGILNQIDSESDPDIREERLKNRFPQEYILLRKRVYPALRLVKIRYCMHHIGMEKDTIHMQEVDTVYMNALQDLRQRRYGKALEVLSAYGGRNTAIACMSLGYDRRALEILRKEPESYIREYLLAILCSRLDMTKEARTHYLNSCRLNSMMEFRGGLDPEINKILKQ